MASVATATSVKFHLSLNVNELDRFVAFLQVLLGCAPQRRHSDYAKFEPEEPALVLSLAPRPAPAPTTLGVAGQGALNHLGFRVRDAAMLVQIQQRLEAAGHETLREDGVQCCHSKQTKFWVRDPDENLWELYVLEDDDHESHHVPVATSARPAAQLPVIEPAQTSGDCHRAVARPAVYTHCLGQGFADALPNDSLDEVQLQGTLNSGPLADRHPELFLRAFAALRPGGTLNVHALVTDRLLSGLPGLPGPASVVTHVPSFEHMVRDVAAAGFVGTELVRLSETPNFVCNGAEMRELQLVAVKPPAIRENRTFAVAYRGPLAQITDDAGNTFVRGRKTVVDAATRDRLRLGSAASSFVFFESGRDSDGPGAC